MFQNMDWGQFIPSLIATFIGIFGPFWVQSKIEKYRKNVDALNKVMQIKNELIRIREDLKSLNDNQRYIDPIKTPIWIGIQNSNELSLLSTLRNSHNKQKKKHVANKEDAVNDWYYAIFSVYGQIEELNKWWNLYTSLRAEGKDLKKEKECIEQIQNNLSDEKNNSGDVESIPQLIKLLDNIININATREKRILALFKNSKK